MVFVPFSPPAATESNQIDDTMLLNTLHKAGDAVSLFISLGKLFSERIDIREEVDKRLSNLEVNMRIRRTYTILLSFTLLLYTNC